MRSGRAIAPALVLAALAAGAGCSDSSDEPPALDECWQGDGGEPAGIAELGTGQEDWEPLPEDGTMPVIAGFQGNHHLLMNVMMEGLDPGGRDVPLAEQPRTHFTITRTGTGERIDDIPCAYKVPFMSMGGDAYQLLSGRTVLVKDEVVDSLDGETLTIRAEILDIEGHLATSEATVMAYLVPLPE